MLTKDYRVGQTSGKCQIIDKFGRTAWATKEEVQSKAILVSIKLIGISISIPLFSLAPGAVLP